MKNDVSFGLLLDLCVVSFIVLNYLGGCIIEIGWMFLLCNEIMKNVIYYVFFLVGLFNYEDYSFGKWFSI